MAFDEKGQADTYKRRIDICKRSYEILTKNVGFNPEDIIFDPNIFPVATGIDDHKTYAVDFFKATKWIINNLPETKHEAEELINKLWFDHVPRDPRDQFMKRTKLKTL